MTRSATINVRIDPQLKQDAQRVLDDVGLSNSKVIELLYRQIAIQGAVPFPIVSERYEGLPIANRQANPESMAVLRDVAAGENIEHAADLKASLDA